MQDFGFIQINQICSNLNNFVTQISSQFRPNRTKFVQIQIKKKLLEGATASSALTTLLLLSIRCLDGRAIHKFAALCGRFNTNPGLAESSVANPNGYHRLNIYASNGVALAHNCNRC